MLISCLRVYASVSSTNYYQSISLRQTKIQIIAYSCGGLLALTLLQLAPENIHKLVMLNSTPCFMAQRELAELAALICNVCQRLEETTTSKFANYFTTLRLFLRY